MSKSGDDDQPVFDDGFIRGGPVELSATQRAIQQPRQAAEGRARELRDQQFELARSMYGQRRRRAVHHRLRTIAQSALVVVVIAGAA